VSYKPSDPFTKEFVTSSPTTGAAVNADTLPVATANRNGTDDGTFALTVASIDTGRYKITGTIPAGYVAGDVVNVSVAATVGGVAGKAIVDTFVLDTKRLGDVTGATGVNLNLTQAVPNSNTAGTTGDALNAARAQGFGRWTVIGTSLTLYGADGTTPVHTFTLDSTTPTSRT
jgi:hypothetical protein